eukprot:1279124-Pleurochrysis_carterae.AAC.2
MDVKQTRAGVIHVDTAIRALEQPMKSLFIEAEELALRQMISGIIPEWQETNDKEKKGTIATMKSWTGK